MILIRAERAKAKDNLAKKDAADWASLGDVDFISMSKACSLLSDNKLHDAATILLRRLDWQIRGENLHATRFDPFIPAD